MADQSFRFVHASDFHLERSPEGLEEIPEHLRELLIEAPYWAAERVFETVLSERADLLVLCGDLLHPSYTGPRGPLFLIKQFSRLAERGVQVYWSGGKTDPPESWPEGFRLPDNVHRFPAGRVAACVHRRDGVPLARLMGASRGRGQAVRLSEFAADPTGLFSIGAVFGKAGVEALRARQIDYWALGGRHDCTTLSGPPQVVHYPGSPQGRSFREQGTHGCTVVSVDAPQQMRISPAPTDVVRWIVQQVEVDETTGRADLEARLREQMRALVESMPGVDLLIRWEVTGNGPLLGQLRRGSLAQELLDGLRQQYGFGPPAAWSVSLQPKPSQLPPEHEQWCEEKSLLGDFLREIRQLQASAEEPVDLRTYLPESQQRGVLAAKATLTDLAVRKEVFEAATSLGIDLLRGQEDPS